jgi:hypothetical protein
MAPLKGRQREWIECDFAWIDPPYPFTWDDVYFVVKTVIGKSGREIKKTLKDDLEKKKKLIKLICIVKGEKFEESKYVEDVEINVKDVELLVEKVLNKKISISFDNNGEK